MSASLSKRRNELHFILCGMIKLCKKLLSKYENVITLAEKTEFEIACNALMRLKRDWVINGAKQGRLYERANKKG